jgi:hypothetical protein
MSRANVPKVSVKRKHKQENLMSRPNVPKVSVKRKHKQENAAKLHT